MISLFLATTMMCGQASTPHLVVFANESFSTGEEKKGPAAGLKVHAQAATKLGAASGVVRSEAELAKLNAKPADVARALKVDKIDFSKHMLVVISGGSRPTGGYGVILKGTEVKDKTLVVHWQLKTPAKDAFVTQAFTHPMLVLLVDRFEGEVVFDPATPPKAGKRPAESN